MKVGSNRKILCPDISRSFHLIVYPLQVNDGSYREGEGSLQIRQCRSSISTIQGCTFQAGWELLTGSTLEEKEGQVEGVTSIEIQEVGFSYPYLG